MYQTFVAVAVLALSAVGGAALPAADAAPPAHHRSDVISVAEPIGARLSATAADRTARTARTARTVLNSMTLPQRVGELLMMGNPAATVSSVTGRDIRKYHVGSIVLTGRSTRGVAGTKTRVEHLQAYTGTASTGGTKLVIAADQEGGYVQVLQGPGFSRMPTALYQGTHWSLDTIRADAATWGRQLERSGVDLDLAPVTDTVSKSFAPHNAPIGYYYREFSYTPYDVLMRGTAFANGLRDAKVGATVKHFPGLGRVRHNTDTSSGVTDTVTTRHSASIEPFDEGIRSGAEAVMVSSAYYTKIDSKEPAAFSATVMKTMLRGDLKFTGVIVSDDLGNAVQVHKWSPGERADLFIENGGDLVLTVNPATVPAMYNAILSHADRSHAFRSKVDAAALNVLQMKAHLGLLSTTAPSKATICGSC